MHWTRAGLLLKLPRGGCTGSEGTVGVPADTAPGSVIAPLLLVQLAVSSTKKKLSTLAITPEQCQPDEWPRLWGNRRTFQCHLIFLSLQVGLAKNHHNSAHLVEISCLPSDSGSRDHSHFMDDQLILREFKHTHFKLTDRLQACQQGLE